MRNKAIILDVEGVTSLGIIRSLSKIPCEIYAINIKSKKGLGFYSKYITKRFYKKAGYSDESLLQLLIDNQEFKGAYIFPTSDEMVIFLLKNKDELKRNNLIHISANIDAEKLLDKCYIKEIAKKAGFDVPKTYSFSQSKSIIFPVIIKPLNSLKFGKEYFEIANNDIELRSALNSKNEKEYFIEEYIQNNELSMYELLLVRNRNKKLSNICPIIKIRQSPPYIGSSSFIRTTSFNSLNNTIKKFLDLIDYVGLADIELKYCSKRKKFFFIETNFRAGAPIYLSTIAGLNLPAIFMGINNFDSPNINIKYWMNDQTDISNIGKQISLIGFLKDLLKTDSFAIFSKQDVIPFFLFWILKIYRKLKFIK